MDSEGASKDPSGSLSPQESKRPAKRAKHIDGSEGIALPPTLPPDSWATVMEFLPLSDVIFIASTCGEIYYDTIPLVTVLHITSSRNGYGLSRQS
jgi:hypothetical protein